MGVRRGFRARATIAAITALNCLVLAAPALAAGTTFSVSGFEDGTGTCTATSSDTATCPTLRAAAGAAQSQAGSTIQLSSGTYQLTLGQLPIGATTIQGTGPGGPGGTTVEQTDGVHRAIDVQAGPATLAGLEVTGGHLAPGWHTCASNVCLGGGILAQGPLVLQNVLVAGNEVTAAAGPAAGDTGDSAAGGGIDYAKGAAAGSAISASTVTGNSAVGGDGGNDARGGAAQGGGVAYAGTGPLVIEDSTIAENHATGGNAGTGASPQDGGAGSGGGVFGQGSLEELVNSTVFGNTAQGGAGSSGGTPGAGAGGGMLVAGGSGTGAVLQSDTIDANQASGTDSNLDIDLGAGHGSFTIHDTILAGGSAPNCGFTPAPSSESDNLEDDPAGDCGFTAANNDLVGVNPQLPNSLGDNGGPTQTLAPAPTSPVLGSGGTCLDPTSTPPNQPLSADQRGQPRSGACDIGAFQAQPPQAASRPVLTGKAARRQTLICNDGTWTGDGPFGLVFQWLRNGVPIPGATAGTYTVGRVDPGQGLACQVTATHYGSLTAESTFLVVTGYPVITFLKTSFNAGSILVSLGCRGVGGQRCIGRLRLTMGEKLRGRKVVELAAATGPVRSRIVSVATHGYSIPARRAATIHVALAPATLRLLAEFGRLPLSLAVSQTTALGTAKLTAHRFSVRLRH